MLDCQAGLLLENGYEVIVVVGHNRKIIYEKTKLTNEIRFVENDLYDVTGPCYSLYLGLRASLPSPVLVIHNDVILAEEDLVLPEESCVITSNDPSKDLIGIFDHEGKVTGMSYASKNKWGQVVSFYNKERQMLSNYLYNNDIQKKYTFQAIEYIVDNGGSFSSIRKACSQVKICKGKVLV